ncbi:hypothetical protein ACTXT7_004444 [Hymenolepis weldensis]
MQRFTTDAFLYPNNEQRTRSRSTVLSYAISYVSLNLDYSQSVWTPPLSTQHLLILLFAFSLHIHFQLSNPPLALLTQERLFLNASLKKIISSMRLLWSGSGSCFTIELELL